MDGKLYRTGARVQGMLYSTDITVGEVLVRLSTHVYSNAFIRIIFLRENGKFFTVTISKLSDSVGLRWLGIYGLRNKKQRNEKKIV